MAWRGFGMVGKTCRRTWARLVPSVPKQLRCLRSTRRVMPGVRRQQVKSPETQALGSVTVRRLILTGEAKGANCMEIHLHRSAESKGRSSLIHSAPSKSKLRGNWFIMGVYVVLINSAGRPCTAKPSLIVRFPERKKRKKSKAKMNNWYSAVLS